MARDGNDTRGELGYISYLLRLWRVTVAGRVCWRASLECPHTGERLGFADADSLWAFLSLQMQPKEGAPPEGPQGGG
jgi:hypothetical protein